MDVVEEVWRNNWPLWDLIEEERGWKVAGNLALDYWKVWQTNAILLDWAIEIRIVSHHIEKCLTIDDHFVHRLSPTPHLHFNLFVPLLHLGNNIVVATVVFNFDLPNLTLVQRIHEQLLNILVYFVWRCCNAPLLKWTVSQELLCVVEDKSNFLMICC